MPRRSISAATSAIPSGSPNRNFAGDRRVRIYNGVLSQSQIAADMAATHSCAVDHYRLNLADGAGLTCTPEPVTLAACSNADCSQVYLGAASVQVRRHPGATLNGYCAAGCRAGQQRIKRWAAPARRRCR